MHRGFRGGIPLDSDLKAMRCICRGIVTITQHRDGMYITHCRRCGTEYGYCDDHPYFTHEYANRGIGEPVIIPGFKPPSESAPNTHVCKICHAPITKEQALKTFEELGRALCEQCGK